MKAKKLFLSILILTGLMACCTKLKPTENLYEPSTENVTPNIKTTEPETTCNVETDTTFPSNVGEITTAATIPPSTEEPELLPETENQNTKPSTTKPTMTGPLPTKPPITTTVPPTEAEPCSPWCLLGDFTTILEPTTTSTGLRVAYCKKCGKEYVDEVAKLIVPEKLENVDARITIWEIVAHGHVSYKYKDLSVLDRRSWDGAPIMKITEDDGLDITYYKQDGSRVNYYLQPVEGYVHSFVILEDGSYSVGLIGDYND